MTVRIQVVNDVDSEMRFIGTTVTVTVENGPPDTELRIQTHIGFNIRRNPIYSETKPVVVPVSTDDDGFGSNSVSFTLAELNEFFGGGETLGNDGVRTGENERPVRLTPCGETPCICEPIIRFEPGHGIDGDNLEFNGSEPPRATKFYRPGHRFVGWFTESGSRVSERSDVTGSGAVTLHARWAEVGVNFTLGDTTNDGRVTSADATQLARLLVGPHNGSIMLYENSYPEYLAADLNGDGKVTAYDLVLLARWLVGHNVRQIIAR